MQVSEKWPNLVIHPYFLSLKMVWSTMYLIWDDEQDYFCISNRTRGIAYGIMDTQVRDFSNYFINARVAAVWSHNFLSGPFDNISGVNNDPRYKSTGFLIAHFFKREDPPFGLNDQGWRNLLCYGSSSHSEVYMYWDTRNKSDMCQGQPAWWEITTGFLTSKRQVHMFGKDKKVYIFSFDIYVEAQPGPNVALKLRSFDEFFKCPLEHQNQSSGLFIFYPINLSIVKPFLLQKDATEVVSNLSTEQHNRSTLIIAITIAAIICLCVWLSLCVISLQDCHKQSSPQNSRPLRRPTVVRNLDSEAD